MINEKGLSFEGWPISLEDNRFYASPIMYDLNKDGMEDIITIDDSGVIRVVTVRLYSALEEIVIRKPIVSSFFYLCSSYITSGPSLV